MPKFKKDQVNVFVNENNKWQWEVVDRNNKRILLSPTEFDIKQYPLKQAKSFINRITKDKPDLNIVGDISVSRNSFTSPQALGKVKRHDN